MRRAFWQVGTAAVLLALMSAGYSAGVWASVSRAVPASSGRSRPRTASIGIAGLPEHARDPAGLVAAADKAIYAAKRAGRNQVLMAGAGVHAAPTPAGPAEA